MFNSSHISRRSEESLFHGLFDIDIKNKIRLIDMYVVSDRFVNFSCNDRVLTVSQFFQFAQLISNQTEGKLYMLHGGQGLTEQNAEDIQKFIIENNLESKIIFERPLLPDRRASKYMTHKHQDKNTIISEPMQSSDCCYESYLMIDENCAEISDHLTGQHVQGSVLMEAARQMTLAVTEKYFIEDENRNTVSFVSNSVQTQFHAYAFPLEIKIHYEIKKRRGLINQNSRFVVLITFLQNAEIICETTYDFSVLNKSYIYQKENEAAKSVISKFNHKERSNEKIRVVA